MSARRFDRADIVLWIVVSIGAVILAAGLTFFVIETLAERADLARPVTMPWRAR